MIIILRKKVPFEALSSHPRNPFLSNLFHVIRGEQRTDRIGTPVT